MNRLKETREARGLRLEDLASRAGITKEYVFKLERGEHTPGLTIARGLADALDVSVDFLFPPVAATASK